LLLVRALRTAVVALRPQRPARIEPHRLRRGRCGRWPTACPFAGHLGRVAQSADDRPRVLRAFVHLCGARQLVERRRLAPPAWPSIREGRRMRFNHLLASTRRRAT
jgi:hypothetical protein